MPAAPRVTAVITTYNRADLLRKSVQSVLDQTLADFELFVSDNASTDHTAAVMAEFASDPRVHYVPLDTNIGPTANFTRGLTLGSAPYLTLVQDDDLMLPRNLERKVALLDEHPDVAIAHAAFQLIDGDDNLIEEFSNWSQSDRDLFETGDEFIRQCFAHGNRVNHSAAVIRRSAAAGDRFDPADGPPCEFGLWLRIARRGGVAYLAEPLTAVRRHAGADSVNIGASRLIDTGYVPTFTIVANVRHVKERFLDVHAPDHPERRQLRTAARIAARKRLLRILVADAPHSGPAGTARLVAKAARVEPTVLGAPTTAKVLLGSLRSRSRA